MNASISKKLKDSYKLVNPMSPRMEIETRYNRIIRQNGSDKELMEILEEMKQDELEKLKKRQKRST
jgi:Tfp pilus assembly protein PilO